MILFKIIAFLIAIFIGVLFFEFVMWVINLW